jgi:broad specificity phosphatase PhoE
VGGAGVALIYLIRHARPSITGVMLGQLDPPLCEQAIAPTSFRAATVFASPLRRASETARRLFPHQPVHTLPELAEIGMGQWEGRSWREIEKGWPELASAKLKDWPGVTPPGGETWTDFETRVQQAWNVIRKAAGPIAVVAHAGVNAVLHHLATGSDPRAFQQGYEEVIPLEL